MTGTAETPTIGGPPGQYLPVTSSLSPAERPVARTSDLQSFWAGPYAGVRVEMKAKYPGTVARGRDGGGGDAADEEGAREGRGEAKAEAGGGASNKRRKKKAGRGDEVARAFCCHHCCHP